MKLLLILGMLLIVESFLYPAVGTTASETKGAFMEYLQKQRTEVEKKGQSFIALLNRHKKYCWDGTDPDVTVQKDYKEIVEGLALLEGATKINATAAQVIASLENFAEYRLAIADAALKSNCLNIADEQYRTIMKEFALARYTSYRDLAKIGIDDVREKRIIQNAVNLKHASPSKAPWELVGEWLVLPFDTSRSEIATCRPKSGTAQQRFVLRSDGAWTTPEQTNNPSPCILAFDPIGAGHLTWKVTSTCNPAVEELWMQSGSARDNILTHDLKENVVTGRKEIGSRKFEYRRC